MLYVVVYLNQWILFMLGTVINRYRGFIHITYTLVLYKNKVLMPILS